MRQGNTAHNLYIITKGEAEVRVAVAGGESRAVKTLGPGDFFGEMGLMTGEPRTATVTALTRWSATGSTRTASPTSCAAGRRSPRRCRTCWRPTGWS